MHQYVEGLDVTTILLEAQPKSSIPIFCVTIFIYSFNFQRLRAAPRDLHNLGDLNFS